MSFFLSDAPASTAQGCVGSESVAPTGYPVEAIPPRPERPEWDFRKHRTQIQTQILHSWSKQFHRIPFFAASPPKRLCTEHPPRSSTCQSFLPSGGSSPYQNESAYIPRPNPTTISNQRMVTRLRLLSPHEPTPLLNLVCLPPLHLCRPRF